MQNENALFAVRAALYELQRTLTDEPFSDAEVERTKGFLDGYVLLFAQTDARKLGYAMDDHVLGTHALPRRVRAEIAKVTAADVNARLAKMRSILPQLEIVLVGPHAAEVKKAISTNAPSPMHYQKDAQGKCRRSRTRCSRADKQIEKLPLGANGDADVDIVPVAKMFD